MHIFYRLSISILLLLNIHVSFAQATKRVVKKVNKTTRSPVKPKIRQATADVRDTTLVDAKAAGIRVRVTTDLGEIILRLYDKTPRHRDNFVKLVNDHFYDSLMFHRIIAGFMIQGGDPESKNAPPEIMLGKGDVGYTIPAELDSTLYHKKGALAAARTNNPEKASSGCQFYIVHGRKYADEEMNMIQMQTGTYFSPAKRMTYKMLGGTPILDRNYTVFGEVESGIEVVDRIAEAEKNGFDRPIKDIRMKMEIIK